MSRFIDNSRRRKLLFQDRRIPPARYRSNLSRALLWAILLIGTGCSLGAKSVPVALHDLGPARHPEKAVLAGGLDAPVWLWDDRIRYRLLYADASAIRFYAQDRWEAPPPALLEPQLNFVGKRQDINLQIRLTEFEQQFDTPQKSRVILGLQIEARSLKTHQVIGKRDLKLEQATATANAAGAISAFIVLTHQAVAEIQDWLPEVSSGGAVDRGHQK